MSISKTTTTAALEIRDLRYEYKSDWTAKRFAAVKGISLEVFEGESFGFLGHNGAGKTTTIKCVLGLVRPSAGEIRMFGVDSRKDPARASIGYLPEQPYFYDHLTVQELMEMYATLAGVPRKNLKHAVAVALERVRVGARASSRMRSLSKGLTQRVAMAQAIVANPRLLVLDEPFSGLDPIGRKEFKDLLCDLKQAGTTIFMCSHILSDVEFLCDRASIMAHGELRGIFNLSEVSEMTGGRYELALERSAPKPPFEAVAATDVSEQGSEIRCTFAKREDAERNLKAAIEQGFRISGYQFVPGNLEDLFVELVKFEEAKS